VFEENPGDQLMCDGFITAKLAGVQFLKHLDQLGVAQTLVIE